MPSKWVNCDSIGQRHTRNDKYGQDFANGLHVIWQCSAYTTQDKDSQGTEDYSSHLSR
jgi:hypothetical protein